MRCSKPDRWRPGVARRFATNQVGATLSRYRSATIESETTQENSVVAVTGRLGDSLRPKSFAGLFGAAPSIALATLLITLSQKGAPFVALEGRSMIVGAFALALYSWTVCVLLKTFLLASWTATMAAFIVWFAVALGASAVLFQLS
jgi:hypothetical protein